MKALKRGRETRNRWLDPQNRNYPQQSGSPMSILHRLFFSFYIPKQKKKPHRGKQKIITNNKREGKHNRTKQSERYNETQSKFVVVCLRSQYAASAFHIASAPRPLHPPTMAPFAKASMGRLVRFEVRYKYFVPFFLSLFFSKIAKAAARTM